ncbi:hypothetical protein ABZ621_36665 [Streptomyces sp. NPDC007863]|uniref:hypothetical protein n=1 Tax=Streptomyces sp. NPDC007863 TaxID=3154894 RepID=UPI0033FE162E
MTFEYRDPYNSLLRVEAGTLLTGTPMVCLTSTGPGEAVVEVPVDHVEEVVAGIRDAARQTGQQPDETTCTECKGTGADPEDEGDYDHTVHMHNPFTVGPCPECHGSGKVPAAGLDASQPATDRAAVLREAADAVAKHRGTLDGRKWTDAAADMLRRMAEEGR